MTGVAIRMICFCSSTVLHSATLIPIRVPNTASERHTFEVKTLKYTRLGALSTSNVNFLDLKRVLKMPEQNEEDMIEGIGSRLALIRGSMSQAAFAEKLGVHKNSLGNYERENRTPDAGFLAKLIANGYDCNWLLTGVGEPRLKKVGQSPRYDGEQPSNFEEDFALIPGYNVQVAAGHGSIAGDEAPTRELAFRRKWLRFRGFKEGDLALVFAKGDSMEPTISDNETVMVDTSEKKLRDGHIYVIRNGDHLLVKRVQTLWNDGVQLLSDNKEYTPQEIPKPDLEALEVIGKVVWVGKDL